VSADFALTYEYTERGKAIIDALKPRVARAAMVYIATDPDREGEAIAWHLVETLKLKKYQRVTFDAITESVIRKAISSPRQLDMNLVRAQAARRAEDRLLGWKVSPLLSRQTGVAGLSAGRVQSVAVRLVVDRQAERNGTPHLIWYQLSNTSQTASCPTVSLFAETLWLQRLKPNRLHSRHRLRSPRPPCCRPEA
jgi:DNA topoisomerase IA